METSETVVTAEERTVYVCDFCGCRTDAKPHTLALNPSVVRDGERWQEVQRHRMDEFTEFRVTDPLHYAELETDREIDVCELCADVLFDVSRRRE